MIKCEKTRQWSNCFRRPARWENARKLASGLIVPGDLYGWDLICKSISEMMKASQESLVSTVGIWSSVNRSQKMMQASQGSPVCTVEIWFVNGSQRWGKLLKEVLYVRLGILFCEISAKQICNAREVRWYAMHPTFWNIDPPFILFEDPDLDFLVSSFDSHIFQIYLSRPMLLIFLR